MDNCSPKNLILYHLLTCISTAIQSPSIPSKQTVSVEHHFARIIKLSTIGFRSSQSRHIVLTSWPESGQKHDELTTSANIDVISLFAYPVTWRHTNQHSTVLECAKSQRCLAQKLVSSLGLWMQMWAGNKCVKFRVIIPSDWPENDKQL